jgi:hypothetical protein
MSIPPNNIAPQSSNIESTGQWTDNPSAPVGPVGGVKMPQNLVAGADGTGKVPPIGALPLFKEGDTKWGTSSIGNQNSDQHRKELSAASAVEKARAEKQKQNPKLDPKHPSIVSQDSAKNVHDAFMSANPQSLGAVLTKAMQSMIMLKMMNKMTSPAGILSMASGGIGGALQGMAGAVGLGSMMGALNQVMPQLSVSGLLNGSATDALHTGMVGMMNNVAVGALSAAEIRAAQSTVSTVAYAMNAIASGNPSGAIDAVATFGGPAFGLQPGSLAAKIALVGPSGTVKTSGIYNGVKIYTTVTTSPNPHLTSNIPILTGAEHVAIAAAAVSNIAGGLSDALGVDNPVGSTLNFVSGATGAVSDLTAGAASLASGLPGINSFTHTALGGIINGGIDNIVSAGLNKVLGVPVSGLLGAASSLLPGIGGSINDTISKAAGINIDGGKINTAMQNATKALALSRAEFNVAQNIFGASRAEAIVQAVDSAANLASTIGGAISHVTAFGDIIHSSPITPLKQIVQTGTQVALGNGLMKL